MNREFTPTAAVTYPPPLGVWAALTCGVTLALVLVGTLVTTYRVGMADPIWPTAPWHLLIINYTEPNRGFLIEHTHRILGYLAGAMILVQTLWLGFTAPTAARRWGSLAAVAGLAAGVAYGMRLVKVSADQSTAALANVGFAAALVGAAGLLVLVFLELAGRDAGRWQRALALLVYLGVIVQGLFGGLRVYLNALKGPELALVHGVFAQVVFALTALLALMTSAGWNRLRDLEIPPAVRRLSAFAAGLALVQIVFGGLLRHFDHPALAQRLHPLLAFGVLFAVTWTAALGGPLRRKAVALLILVLVQAAFGVEAWLRTAAPAARYGAVTTGDVVIRTGHVLLGFGIFASAVLLAARARKPELT